MGISKEQFSKRKTALSQKLRMANWTGKSVWTPMMGFTSGKDGDIPRSAPAGAVQNRTIAPTYKPIEVVTDHHFDLPYATELEIPVAYKLGGLPILGDAQKKGTGTNVKFAYIKSKFNLVSKVINLQDGLMGDYAIQQLAPLYKKIKDAAGTLSQYAQDYMSVQPYHALTRGYSHNVWADSKMGVTAKSHPNFYVAGSGKVAFSHTPATYENNIKTAIDAMDGNDKVTIGLLENLITEASNKRILRTDIEGHEAFYVIIDSFVARDLRALADWKLIRKDALNQEKGLNPIFSGKMEGFLSGAYILVDDNAFGLKVSGMSGYDAAQGVINYGNTNFIDSPVDTSNRRLIYLVGQSAMTLANIKSLHFEDEMDDFKTKKETVGMAIYGVNRSDVIDDDGSFGTKGQFLENTSSLVCAVSTDTALTW
jgi:hypothetical protein